MEMVADILLVAGALGAGFYCYILARRLSRFNDLENGVGGAVAVHQWCRIGDHAFVGGGAILVADGKATGLWENGRAPGRSMGAAIPLS